MQRNLAVGRTVLSNLIGPHDRIEILDGPNAGHIMTVQTSEPVLHPDPDHILTGTLDTGAEISFGGLRPVRFLGPADTIDLTVHPRKPHGTFAISQYEDSLTARLEVVSQGDRLTIEISAQDRAGRHLGVKAALGFDLDRNATFALIGELNARLDELDKAGWITPARSAVLDA